MEETEKLQTNQAEIDNLASIINIQLGLEAAFPSLPETVRLRMAMVIAETVVEISGLLAIPTPNFGIMDAESAKRAPDVAAVTTLQRDTKSNVDYNSKFLMRLGKRMRNPVRSSTAEYILRSATAHELYHIHEMVNLRRKVTPATIMDGNAERVSDLIWRADKSEFAATSFADQYIKGRKVHGWRERLGKRLTIIDNWIILNSMQATQSSKRD